MTDQLYLLFHRCVAVFHWDIIIEHGRRFWQVVFIPSIHERHDSRLYSNALEQLAVYLNFTILGQA